MQRTWTARRRRGTGITAKGYTSRRMSSPSPGADPGSGTSSPSSTDPETRPTVAVDLRALVPDATGIGIYTRSLLTRLAARGGFRLLGLSHRPVREPEELKAAGVERAPGSSGLPLGVLWQQLELPRLLERHGADLLWSPLQTLPVMRAARGPDGGEIPAVVTVHDLTVVLYPETHRLKVRWSQLPFLGRSLARARRIVAVSEATARDLRFHFPDTAERIRVVPEGVDPVFRPASEPEREAIREELGAPDGYLLYVGTLEPRKNVETLLSAWERLHDDREDAPPLLLAGGEGWHNRALRRRLTELEPHGVRHLGRVEPERLVRLFQGAKAFVYPSLYEGFGLPPLEAMACGVPVVASTASSLPEVVGDAGLLVPPRDSGALAAEVGRVLDDPELARELGARGRERAARFTWERAADEMASVFRDVLRESPSP